MTQVIVKQEFLITNEDWYQSMADECRAIIVEREFNSRMEIIQGKWELGKRIIEDENYKKFGKGNRKIISQLAKDIECSESNLYFSTQFYEKFPQSDKLEALKIGKNISWHQITQKYLGKRDLKTGTPRKMYKLDEILTAFRKWILENHPDVETDEHADFLVKEFQEKYLIKLRK